MARLSDTFLASDRAKKVFIKRELKGVSLIIGSALNPDYIVAMQKATEEEDDTKREKLVNEARAEYLFLSFDGLEDDSGKAIVSTLKTKFKLIKEYPEILVFVWNVANDTTNFLEVNNITTGSEIKNLKTSQAGR